MKITLLQKLLLITSFSLLVGLQSQGQTLKDAIDAYTKGIELIDSDISAAIENLERSHEIAINLGAEGDEVKEQAEIQIPSLYYERAMNFYRERNIEQAVDGFQAAIDVAEEFKNQNVKSRSEAVLHQLYFIQGNGAFRENENDKALELFNMALEINPQHARSHLGKGLVYRRLENTELFKESMDMAIESGLMTNDESTVETAESTARDFFLVRALRLRGEEKYDEALELLNTSLVYDQKFPETHFLFATIYNEQSRFQDAVKSAGQALELLNGSRDETAKIYFELGKAYAGLGNTSMACTAYRDAAHGQYVESAKYQMEHVLKCP
jgi:tetratricopeptide (TPR) repeat protein